MLTPHRRPPVPPEHPPPSDGVLEHVVADLRRRSVADLAAGRTELARSRADMADALAELIPSPVHPAPVAVHADGSPGRHRSEPHMIFSRSYWAAALERAVSAGAAAATAGVSLDALDGLDLDTWRTLGITFGVGALFSLVKGLGANAANGGLGPGIGKAEVTAPAVALPAEDGEQRGEATLPAVEVTPDVAPGAVGTPAVTAPAEGRVVGDPAPATQPVEPAPLELTPSALMSQDIAPEELAAATSDAASDADLEHGQEVTR